MALNRQDISTWLWRLLPGNPIFVRVLWGGGRRVRHLWIRLGYLSVLFFVMFIALLGVSPGSGALDDLAKSSTQVFRFISIAQLAMICFLAPVFMAAAITQERDAQTYNILLSTPLSNAQIVLGSLMSRLFFVLVLLIAGVPIFCATTLYGGVTLRQILLSTGIAGATAILTGSLAIGLSVTRVGTRRTIFSFYLAIALYLLVVGAMGYPQSFRRSVGAVRYSMRGRAIDAWAAQGHAYPDADKLLTVDSDRLDPNLLARAGVTDAEAARDLLMKLREADGLAAVRQESELTFFGCRFAPANADGERMSWLSPFHPLLTLQVALNVVEAPATAAGYPWPLSRLLTRPDYGYMTVTLLASLLIVVFSMFWVRRGSREGEMSRLARLVDRFRRQEGVVNGERRRKARRVWHNPVAWREARTRASFTGRGAMRHLIVIAGLVSAGVLLAAYRADWGWFEPSELRFWLTGLIIIEFTLILLMAANSAATAITRERETNTIELLLCSPLTSGYLIRGKLRGLVSFLVPLILVPAVSLLVFALCDLYSGRRTKLVWLESAFEMALVLGVYTSFACMLGLQMSLQFRRTVHAVFSTIGILMVVSFALGGCGFGLVEISEGFGAVIAPFTPFTAVSVIVNPQWTLSMESASARELAQVRIFVLAGVGMACAIYALIVLAMYHSMIRNFDMTVRRQAV